MLFRRTCSSVVVTGSLGQHARHKSYVLKFLRGQLPFDLKDVGSVLGALYGPLPDADEYGVFRQPDNVLEAYNQLGYVKLLHPVLDPQQSDKLSDEADQLANNEEHHPKTEVLYATSLANLTEGPLFHCQGQWRASWGMHDAVYMPSITVPASQLLGDAAVKLWYDEVMIKKERVGPCVPWGQLYARWQHTRPINHVTALIALDNLNKDRGAPCVIPGSHRWREGELFPTIEFDAAKDEAAQMNSIWDHVSEDEREVLMDMPPVTLDMRRGDVAFVHPLTLMSTHGNRSLDPCRCLMVHFMGVPTYAVGSGALLPHTTKFMPDSPIDGPYYPTVFDPALTEEPTLPGGEAGEMPQLETHERGPQ